jgi:hypothetical protein
MKILIPILAMFIILSTSCKKDEIKLPTEMRVVVNSDTVFVTTNVTSGTRTANFLYITGTSTDGNKKVELGLSKYSGKAGNFDIDRRGLDGSTAYYRDAGNLTEAQNGRIVVTSVADGVIKGTFNLYYQSTYISGSFIAPAK